MSADVAKRFLITVRAHIASLSTFPMAGRSHGDIRPGLGTINDVVTTFSQALLAADTKRLALTTSIGLDETSVVKRPT